MKAGAYQANDIRLLARVAEKAFRAMAKEAPIHPGFVERAKREIARLLLSHYNNGERDPDALVNIAMDHLRTLQAQFIEVGSKPRFDA